MFDIYSPHSNINFYGEYFLERRLIKDGVDQGKLNPNFRVSKKRFTFDIISTRHIEKKQPITNLVYLVTEMTIDTKETNDDIREGGFIEFEDKLYIIKSTDRDDGPNKSIYRQFKYNPHSKIRLIVEEFNDGTRDS